MDPLAFTTDDYRAELVRVYKARRRNTAIVVLVDLAIMAGVAYFVLSSVGV